MASDRLAPISAPCKNASNALHGLRIDGRRHLLDGGIELKRLYAEQHGIVGLPDLIGGHELRLQRRIAMWTYDSQPRFAQLRGPRRPDQKGDVPPGLRQSSAEIAAGRTGSNHKQSHDAVLF